MNTKLKQLGGTDDTIAKEAKSKERPLGLELVLKFHVEVPWKPIGSNGIWNFIGNWKVGVLVSAEISSNFGGF